MLEAAIGIEPMNKGFADRLSLVPQMVTADYSPQVIEVPPSGGSPVSAYLRV